ncbi:A24 family peptidase [Amycolatopsis sp. H20-H5]|uniref:A24 family peptidase n=1 Tax=Amycolatopsis sp. H20-H5 TaxID=3046309 RepID=UPI002DB66751|nr:A24 family peptidase [Amycolatopsis sp. H20-H5]MEC3978897.1 A24 family peptidase [Amycolatopsis sp. H20-H5]
MSFEQSLAGPLAIGLWSASGWMIARVSFGRLVEASLGPVPSIVSGFLDYAAVASACAFAGLASTIKTTPQLAMAVCLIPVMLPLAAIDALTQRLPNRLIATASAAAGVTASAMCLIGYDSSPLVDGLEAALLTGAWWIVIATVTPGQLGSGDVKIATLLGFAAGWSSWPTVALSVIFGPVLGLIQIVGLRCTGRRVHQIAFGPALIAGTYVALVATS